MFFTCEVRPLEVLESVRKSNFHLDGEMFKEQTHLVFGRSDDVRLLTCAYFASALYAWKLIWTDPTTETT